MNVTEYHEIRKASDLALFNRIVLELDTLKALVNAN